MDTEGKRRARQEISEIKVVAANMVMDVLDRAIQVHGSLGMSDDTPLAAMWRFSRMLRVADGPDEVHKMVIARRELEPRGQAGRGRPARRRARPRADPAPDRNEPTGPGRVQAGSCHGLVGGLRQALDDLRELLKAVVGLAVLARRVAGVDALEDDRQLPVAEGDEEVDLAQVAARRAPRSAPDLVAAR